MQDGDGSFEWLRERLPEVAPAHSAGQRELIWVDAAHSVAVARDEQGRLEIFLPGAPLEARIPVVASSLSHQVWHAKSGEGLAASRVVLPAAQHFDGVVAFLCAELLENGAAADAQAAFARTEPSIALGLTRARLGNEVLTGLAGELSVLVQLLRTCHEDARDEFLGSWLGSTPSSRDFQIGSIGIEVKTTTGSSSSHQVQGLHQVEVGFARDGAPETVLHLLSLGLRWLDVGEFGGTSIPSIVDEIVGLLSSPVAEQFLDRLKQYGGDAATGYTHARDRDVPLYSRPFTLRFERLYDMTDPWVLVPRRSDMIDFLHVAVDSVAFRVDLPAQVRGDVNPIQGLSAIAVKLVSSAG